MPSAARLWNVACACSPCQLCALTGMLDGLGVLTKPAHAVLVGFLLLSLLLLLQIAPRSFRLSL